ncbi:hypothetical protein AMAG_14070 [Allomyces macrogynus ATCC 38327]|uniref:Uncharacterized protein n=1 Tax=Allomyces macrogynus (strain ATCC 38327) TaxID=578462 RepID=A0A0L0T474_ALLM3|nr:hypothetical protein AMAG_14070 [Allomyces macrogynus ATCC 38327]|eukprot:KNE69505.1 hypothetical protein AMAG_14070 [Allomyces macrogynus ATCC 38327]
MPTRPSASASPTKPTARRGKPGTPAPLPNFTPEFPLILGADLAHFPAAVLRRIDRASFQHPRLPTLPWTHVAQAAAYSYLGDLSSTMTHLEEAQRLLRLDGTESSYLELRISTIAYTLAIQAKTEHKDPLKCLLLLDRVKYPTFRTAVMVQTAMCFLDLSDFSTALPMFQSLAEQHPVADFFVLCARMHLHFGQWPTLYIQVQRAKELDPDHPGLPPLLQALEAKALEYKREAARLSHQRHFAAAIEVLQHGLEIAPVDEDLLYLKADALLSMGQAQQLLQFLGSCPGSMRDDAKNNQEYARALDFVDQLRALRRAPFAQDHLWRGELLALLGIKTHDDAIRDLQTYRTMIAANPTLVDDPMAAHATLCQLYLGKATDAAVRKDWRAAIKALDQALEVSWPPTPTPAGHKGDENDDDERPPSPLTPLPPAGPVPTWARALPDMAQAPRLHFLRARAYAAVADTHRAIDAVRTTLRLRPEMLDAKQLFLDLTRDQEALAGLAVSQNDRLPAMPQKVGVKVTQLEAPKAPEVGKKGKLRERVGVRRG